MKFWSECTEKLEAKLSQEEFNTWIKPLKADINENNLEISAPNDFVLTYVKENLGQIIEKLVNKSDESLIVKFKTLDKSTFVEKLNVTEENIHIKSEIENKDSKFVKDIDLTLTVGKDYDGTKSSASFENGLLTLLVDKKETKKGKTLKISY